jgi:hypothetical protein
MNTLLVLKAKMLHTIFYLCFFILLSGCNNQNNWFQFISEEKNFKIKFPEKPVVHDPAFLGSGQATIQIDQFDYKDHDQNYQALSYTYSEELIQKASQLDSLFSHIVQSTLNENKGTILKKTNVKIKEHPGKEFTIKLKNEDPLKIVRIFLMENNRLQINIASSYEDTSPKYSPEIEKDAAYFLDSFELINEY